MQDLGVTPKKDCVWGGVSWRTWKGFGQQKQFFPGEKHLRKILSYEDGIKGFRVDKTNKLWTMGYQMAINSVIWITFWTELSRRKTRELLRVEGLYTLLEIIVWKI